MNPVVDRVGKSALAIVVLILVIVAYLVTTNTSGVAEFGVVVAVVTVSILAVLDSEDWLLALGAAVVVLALASIAHSQPDNVGWFALCVIVGWVVLRSGTLSAYAIFLLCWILLLMQFVSFPNELSWIAWLGGVTFTFVVSGLGRRQLTLLNELKAAQAQLASRVRAEERSRIAHEVHDVIGHALTVSLLHISSARLALDEDPTVAADSLAEAERLSQQSLAEVRRTIGMMRNLPGSPVTPTPGAADVESLVEDVRRAGANVELSIHGRPSEVGATEGLTLYRILQEALTNVLRHAPNAHAEIEIEFEEKRTRISVRSDGKPGPAGTGVGLMTMRERAELLGGTLKAGPNGTGWLVEAELPR